MTPVSTHSVLYSLLTGTCRGPVLLVTDEGDVEAVEEVVMGVEDGDVLIGVAVAGGGGGCGGGGLSS